MQTRKLTIALGALIAGVAIGPAALAAGQSQKVQQQVQQMDANNDGTVSQSEFNNYWQQKFRTADTNNDGKLSKQECKTAVRNMKGTVATTKFDRMWNQADTNRDGYLSQQEDLAYHDKMFNKADSNNDGRLTKAEIRTAIQKPNESVASL